jgi:hypothetical protein
MSRYFDFKYSYFSQNRCGGSDLRQLPHAKYGFIPINYIKILYFWGGALAPNLTLLTLLDPV